jgi:hypothetical protein
MKELEVKSMLADPNIPNDYKLGGRLDERFLAGVEYAEAAMEKAPTVWVARDKGKYGKLFLYGSEPNRDGDLFDSDDVFFTISTNLFPEVTWENSPRKVRLILEDEE